MEPLVSGHLWLICGMLENIAFSGRETETQPGKPGGSKAHQLCLAEWDSQPSWAVCGLSRADVSRRLDQALGPTGRGQPLLTGWSEEAWSGLAHCEAPNFPPVSKQKAGHTHQEMKPEVW